MLFSSAAFPRPHEGEETAEDNHGHTAASHAWVDVYLPEAGWIALDPTHNREQTGEYVRVAIGRDYADVPPTRGIFVGNARESMEVSVTVTQV